MPKNGYTIRMKAYIIANVLSAIAAVFLVFGCASSKRENVYMLQSFECAFLIFAQIAFGQSAAAAALLVSLARNVLLWRGRYGFFAMLSVCLLTLSVGVAFGGGELVGLIPVVAGVVYSVAAFCARRFVGVKLSLLLNIALWSIYAALIGDMATLLVNSVAFVINLASLVAFISRRSTSRGTDRQRRC